MALAPNACPESRVGAVPRLTAYHDGMSQPLELGSFERDNHSSIWEWVSLRPSSILLLQMEDLANAKDAVLRFHGQQYTKDHTLSAGDGLAPV